MSSPTYAAVPGQPLICQLAGKKGFAPTVGQYATLVFRGSESEIEAKAQELCNDTNNLVSVEVYSDDDGIFWKCEATYKGGNSSGFEPTSPDNAIVRTYSFSTVPLQKDLLEHPKIQAEFRKVSSTGNSVDSALQTKIDAKVQIRAMVDAFFKGVDVIPDPTKKGATLEVNMTAIQTKVAAAGMDWETVWLPYFNLRGIGVDHFTTSTFALTVTSQVPRNSSLRVVTSNVGRIYSKNSMVVETKLPNNYIAELDNTSVWWKQDVKGETAADGNTVVVESWIAILEYSEFIYGPLL